MVRGVGRPKTFNILRVVKPRAKRNDIDILKVVKPRLKKADIKFDLPALPARRTPADRLRAAADLNEQRNALYGESWRETGALLMVLFPEGIHVTTQEEARRLNNVCHLAEKLRRYCSAFHTGGHEDSLDDISVIAQMQAVLDND